MTVALGVDGSRGRWVTARVELGHVAWSVAHDAAGVLAAGAGCDAVGIDVPVGVADGADRAADLAARRRLAGSGSSVFATPTRQAFEAAREALAAARARGQDLTLFDCWAVAHRAQQATHPRGAGLSKQAWGLAAGIVDVDAALAAATRGEPGVLDRVVEVHPECSLRAAAGEHGAPPAWYGKRTAPGAAARMVLLGRALAVDLPAALGDPALARVPLDDALDALAAAWSARRWATGAAETLGDPRGVRTGWSASGALTPGGAPQRMPQRIVV